MKRLFLILMFFISTLSYCPPKVDKQESALELVEKNYNQLAVISGVSLCVGAALNYDKIQNYLNGYYLSVKPYLNQQNLAKFALALGTFLAVPLVYLKVKGKDDGKR